ncbi:nucleotide exchange factor GrpE [Mycolicibacterium agri]|uniref:Protein GrpE n=1 Tax=Mycolicibacterium agri TaxID=36811 RepID=A0A2A7MV80_MYCAG|nr:nucleotide exchange factor GrpE [Mycolicibacterium agri]PEG35596.1 nucleotide exchange factor GrpE [Mycolicibacterium agri]GFG52894.1 protein GrpE [Mycolicibacterium agri]
MSSNDSHEPVTVTDKRRVDPETGEVRSHTEKAETPEQASGPAPSGSAPGAAGGEKADTGDKVAELTADLQRVQAEYTNYRKRALRDQQLAAERAKAAVISELLSVLDDIDRARAHGDLESGPLKAIADKLVSTLEGFGLSAFGTEGEEFDPALHEAVQHEGDGTHPVVGTVMRRGYKIGDQVLRHAMVGVVDTVPDAEEQAEAGSSEGPDAVDKSDAADAQAAESEN